MDTLLLDRTTWDLCLDSAGNIAMASNPYAIAQDVASAIKLYQGELWYDTTQGVPYQSEILGNNPPIALLKARFIAAALTVPEVASADCFISSLTNRQLVGQVQVTSTGGVVAAVGFRGTVTPPPSGNFILDVSTLDSNNVIG